MAGRSIALLTSRDCTDPRMREIINTNFQQLANDEKLTGQQRQAIQDVVTSEVDVHSIVRQAMLAAHPIGCIVITNSLDDPRINITGTQWEQIKDTVIVAAGDEFIINETGGQKEITITGDNLPTAFFSSGEEGVSSFDLAEPQDPEPINIMNPYIAKYIFERIS